MNQRRMWRNFDFLLLAVVVILIGYGVIMIRSAIANSPGLEGLDRRQMIYGFIGLALIIVVSLIDYRSLTTLYIPIYLALLGLLILVDMIGQTRGGAQRWIDLGLFPIQPSEISKILVIMVMARYLANREGQMHRGRNVLLALLILIPPVVLIYLEPDLGTAITVAAIGGAMIVLSGMRLLHIGMLALGSLAALPAMWFAMEDYMRQRVLIFLHPESDPTASYNVKQALISIGSGGWLGKGYGQGSQSQLHFLRVRHTDFIFSVVGEELGFVGAVLLIALIVILLMRLLRIAERARDPLGRYLALGVASLIFFQSTVNIGMNLNLMPVTGIPLPFVSYGGSSLLTMCIGIGLAEAVALRHRKIEF
ncbi:MAG: rod shape-determining protein RodA [Anaerolineae bacterium]